MRCNQCGGRLVRTPEGFLVCSQCGAVMEGSNLALDSYTNFTFQDDWRLRREPKIRRREWSWRAVVSTEASESSTAALVKYHLVELLRTPKTFHLVGVVKEHCRTSSLRDLFRDFIRATNLDYLAARKIFEEACRLAGVSRVPDLSPTSVMSPGLADVRKEDRERRLEGEYRLVRRLWGERVERLARRLAKCTLFQPEKPLVLGASIAVHLGIASRKEALKAGVGKKALETTLTRIRRLSRLTIPDLVAAVGLEAAAELRSVPAERLSRLVVPSLSKHYSPVHRLPRRRRRILEEALKIIGEHGELGPGELAEMLGISYGYAKVVLYRLRKKGLLRRLQTNRTARPPRRNSALARALEATIRRGPLTPRELSVLMGVSRGYARVLLFRLKQRGLVERLEDGRYVAAIKEGFEGQLVAQTNVTLGGYNSIGRPEKKYVRARGESRGESMKAGVPRHTAVELVRYYRTYPGYVKACRRSFDADRHGELVRPLTYREWRMQKWIDSIPRRRLEEALLDATREMRMQRWIEKVLPKAKNLIEARGPPPSSRIPAVASYSPLP